MFFCLVMMNFFSFLGQGRLAVCDYSVVSFVVVTDYVILPPTGQPTKERSPWVGCCSGVMKITVLLKRVEGLLN